MEVRSNQEALTRHRMGRRIGDVLATTDHKVVGYLYLSTSFAFFLAAGAMAVIMRAELARPGDQVVGAQMYDQLVTIHGTVMLLRSPRRCSRGSRTCSCPCRSARRTSRSRG